MKKFSIIIPVFNAQDDIFCCLESLEKQDFRDFEIIVVDDHSNDQTLQKIDGFCHKFPQISLKLVKNRKNLGPSASRNRGLERATGEYVIFVDADDRILRPDFLSNLIKSINQTPTPDIVLYGGYIDYQNARGKTFCRIKLSVKDRDLSQTFQLRRKFFRYVWLMCMRREFLAQNKLHFIEEINFYEDVVFRSQAFSFTDRIAISKGYFYNYTRKLSHSSLSSNRNQTLKSKLKSLQKSLDYMTKLTESGAVPADKVQDFLWVTRLLPMAMIIVLFNHLITKILPQKPDVKTKINH